MHGQPCFATSRDLVAGHRTRSRRYSLIQPGHLSWKRFHIEQVVCPSRQSRLEPNIGSLNWSSNYKLFSTCRAAARSWGFGGARGRRWRFHTRMHVLIRTSTPPHRLSSAPASSIESALEMSTPPAPWLVVIDHFAADQVDPDWNCSAIGWLEAEFGFAEQIFAKKPSLRRVGRRSYHG